MLVVGVIAPVSPMWAKAQNDLLLFPPVELAKENMIGETRVAAEFPVLSTQGSTLLLCILFTFSYSIPFFS